AGAAMVDLERSPEEAVRLFRSGLRPFPPGPSRAGIDRLIADLDAGEFATRDRAREALERLGELAEAALREARAKKPPLEQARHIERLLDRIDGPETEAEQPRALPAEE